MGDPHPLAISPHFGCVIIANWSQACQVPPGAGGSGHSFVTVTAHDADVRPGPGSDSQGGCQPLDHRSMATAGSPHVLSCGRRGSPRLHRPRGALRTATEAATEAHRVTGRFSGSACVMRRAMISLAPCMNQRWERLSLIRPWKEQISGVRDAKPAQRPVAADARRSIGDALDSAGCATKAHLSAGSLRTGARRRPFARTIGRDVRPEDAMQRHP
jgi:hypothetical protein